MELFFEDIKLLELFAGSRSISRAAEAMGMRTFSIDHKPFDGIDLVKDVEHVIPSDIPFVPDVLWGSPLCTTYSIAAISHHRDGIKPKTDLAEKSDRLLIRTASLIKYFLSINPSMKYFIENPVGMMRKMPVMQQFPRTTVTYCSYGDSRMKPTDIWTNNLQSIFNPDGWQPRQPCFNGNRKCHHEPAPRGSSFCASAWSGWPGSIGWPTRDTRG